MIDSPPPNPQSSGKNPIEFDDWVGIVVALTTIGTILAWSVVQMDRGGNMISLPSVSASPTSLPTSIATPRTLESPLPRATSLEVTTVPTEFLTKPKTPSPIFPLLTTSLEEPVPTGSPTPISSPVPTGSPTPTDLGSSPAVNFSDVPDDFWARPFITAVVESGLFGGERQGTFQPNQPMTRADFAVEIEKAFDRDPRQNELDFQDVASDRPTANSIKWTAETGFLRGYPDRIFRPDQPITRAQVLVALASGLQLEPPSDPSRTLQRYRDADKIPKYGIGSVAAATEASLVVNYPKLELLNPDKAATRAEVASFLYQALVKEGKVQMIPSEYIVQPN